MAKSIKVEIDRRILRIGHESYQMSLISRVSTYERRSKPISGGIWLLLLGIGMFLYGAAEGVGAALLLGILAAALGGGLLFYRPSTYLLLIEAAGTTRGVLSSRKHESISQAKDFILNGIQNPPTKPSFIYVDASESGDTINVFGKDNIGKMVN